VPSSTPSTRFQPSRTLRALGILPLAASSKALLPLGVLLLAGSVNSWAQAAADRTLGTVVVKDRAEAQEGKDAVRATTSTIGKGNQQLRDIPQSVTVVTEKLIDDRNLDTLKDVLQNTAGVTFLAAEGGEEDIRLRGFSLAATGDIFIDGMRDPAFYDRDTFNLDRIDLLRGSASMLFGRGSTGGAVNQVSKQPRLVNEHEVTTTIGNHKYRRLLGDFNFKTGEDSALRINAMTTKADNNGAGSGVDKSGIALGYRLGIGTRDEFSLNLFYLDNDNPRMNYGLPWIKPNASDTSASNTIISSLNPDDYYGMASDRSAGIAKHITLTHTHRFSSDSELKTGIRTGKFSRDQRAGTVRFGNAALNGAAVDLTNFGPNTVFTRGTQTKIQDVHATYVQTDYSSKFSALGLKHEVLAGVDFSHERKAVYALRNAAQGGVNLTKPNTTAGTPNDGAWIDEGSRVLRPNNEFSSKGVGVYAQDLVQVAPHWKVLAGLRYDRMKGDYGIYNNPASAAAPVGIATAYQQDINELSKRVGVLFQPNDLHSFHISYGTSFNTSGDAYSYNEDSANTPPESSENIEIGAKLDSADKRFTTRLALFRSTKKNERNTDPDTAATRLLLSGKRHTAGFELDVTGRLTPQWEVYLSYMWMPIAKVDKAASTATTVGNREGDRPGLSPRHSGSVWTTYQVTPALRLGGGINFRSGQAPADVTAPAWEAPGYATVDLMAEYAFNQTFTLKANVSNVGDKLYANSLYRGHYIPGPGRLYQLALSAKF
jgi:catecholate siderophore receptor